MSPDPEDILDLSEEASRQSPPDTSAEQAEHSSMQGRPWISVYFECCNVYARIYRDADGTAYTGWCPRCAGKVTVRIGPDGTSTRMFRAR